MAKAFRRMTNAELKGRRVRLLREIEIGSGRIFGAGTIMTIVEKFKGLELEQVERCEACGCGHRNRARRVDFADVELLPIEASEVARHG